LKTLEVGDDEVYRARRNNSSMWSFKKIRNLAGPDEFPAAIDALAEKLRSNGFVIDADQLHSLTHEFVATTSNELYGELHFALKKLDHEHRALPRDIVAEVRHLLKSIDKIWR
jgi:hypothetical protein